MIHEITERDIRVGCPSACRKTVSLRASAHTGVAISRILEHFYFKICTFYFFLGDRHTSVRAYFAMTSNFCDFFYSLRDIRVGCPFWYMGDQGFSFSSDRWSIMACICREIHFSRR